MSKVKMTSVDGRSEVFDEETASRMCRVMKNMKRWPWVLPDTHEFIDGYVKRKSNKTIRSRETE
jgi:hypothetical protein